MMFSDRTNINSDTIISNAMSSNTTSSGNTGSNTISSGTSPGSGPKSNFRRIISFLVIIAFSFSLVPVSASVSVYADSASARPFSDVPADSYALKDIYDLRDLGITYGIGNNRFGYGLPVTRAEFITFLCRLMKWEDVNPAKGSFVDNQDKSKWYYIPVETALANGAITTDSPYFRPMEPATREEMAVMLVRCLGYDSLARSLNNLETPFHDVKNNKEYITIAKDFGIIFGTGNGFNPSGIALKEQAAAMMMRMYNKLNKPVKDLNAFYAISSYSQSSMIPYLDTLSCGWSSLEYDKNGDIIINTSRTLNGEYKDFYLPQGFSGIVDMARDNGVAPLISVYGTNEKGLLEKVLTSETQATKIINEICKLAGKSSRLANDGTVLESASFDGVVIDFENMKGSTLKNAFNSFLLQLREKLPAGSKLYVAVHPVINGGSSYYDAYDYREIGEIADKVILMAHDFDTKGPISEEDMARGFSGNPSAPVKEVYIALSKITDPVTGVADKSKIELQLSFSWVEWLTKDSKTIRNKPGNYSYDNFMKIFSNYRPTVYFSDYYKCPYLKFTDEQGILHTVWYEDERSVEEKIKLAQLFGIGGISLWRLGNIPDGKNVANINIYQEVWGKITDMTGR